MKKSFYQVFKDKTQKALNNIQEKRGIYNVSFNDKNSTLIEAELEWIENVIIDYVVHYIKGWHNERRDKGRGAEHIKFHLEPNSQGQITIEELLNLGNYLREYLKVFKEPFIDDKGAKIYEWENDDKTRFRIVSDRRADMSPCDNCTATHTLTNQGTNATSIAETIITFYSDRNLNQKMEFKNPKLKEYYQNKKQESENSLSNSKINPISKFKNH